MFARPCARLMRPISRAAIMYDQAARHALPMWGRSRPAMRTNFMQKPSEVSPDAPPMTLSMPVKAVLAGMVLSGVGATFVSMGAPRTPEEHEEAIAMDERILNYDDSNVLAAYWFRACDRVSEFIKGFSDPTSKKLLPDMLPEPYQRPYTLVIEMEDFLIHSSWDIKSGWKTAKRPGVEYFLAYMSQFFEIVIYTHASPFYAEPILAKLDPNGFIMYRLYRDSTKYINGHHVKSVKSLNRDPKRTIVLDHDALSYQLDEDNGLQLSKWTGKPGDRELADIIPFLQTLVQSGVDDVRPVLAYYKGKDVITTFRENQEATKRAVDEQRRKEAEDQREAQGKGLWGVLGSGAGAGAGADSQQVLPGAQGMPDAGAAPDVGMTAVAEPGNMEGEEAPKKTLWTYLFGTADEQAAAMQQQQAMMAQMGEPNQNPSGGK